MTEAEWLSSNEPRPMLEFLRGKISDRKLRLLTCAFYRHLYGPSDPRTAIIAVGEKYADGMASNEELKAARELAGSQERSQELRVVVSDGISSKAYQLWHILSMGRPRMHCLRIRDIFGKPFRPIIFSPEWRAATALSLAQQMYESHEFGAMPILADALQDAGCESADVLDHCRGPGPHVRGCWVVDLVLGKE